MKTIRRIQLHFRTLDDVTKAACVVAVAPVSWAIGTVFYMIYSAWRARLGV